MAEWITLLAIQFALGTAFGGFCALWLLRRKLKRALNESLEAERSYRGWAYLHQEVKQIILWRD